MRAFRHPFLCEGEVIICSIEKKDACTISQIWALPVASTIQLWIDLSIWRASRPAVS